MFVRAMLLILVFMSLCTGVWAQNSFLGVLEELPGVYSGEQNFRGVRVAFQKNNHHWQALPSKCPDQNCLRTISSKYPLETNWTISFDGKKLGQIAGRTPKEFKFYSHVGLQEIMSGNAIPTVGKKSTEYGGFTDASVYRPLVANSHPYFEDPEMWKPSQPPTDLVRLLRRQFRRKFPIVSNCADPNENTAKAWPYTDDDIKIVKAYSSKNRWTVARLRLEEYRCDGPADDPFIDQWFAISPAKEIKFLDQGMWLVDAGDYDNDGRSELLFSIDRYNKGGYELFYDDFRQKATFQYGFH